MNDVFTFYKALNQLDALSLNAADQCGDFADIDLADPIDYYESYKQKSKVSNEDRKSEEYLKLFNIYSQDLQLTDYWYLRRNDPYVKNRKNVTSKNRKTKKYNKYFVLFKNQKLADYWYLRHES